jgi:hypothetical protein
VIVFGYGMGTDSTAILLRWILEPATRPCPLGDLLMVTAQTGDEWPYTGQLVTRHVLPLLREHGIRWVQVARATGRQGDGITVLADTRHPQTVHLAGGYRLSQELLAAGTVPQVGGARLCSAKAKGWPLDTFVHAETGGEPYQHVVGFEANETGRALRDARHNTEQRTGVYPLIGWGWDRHACEDYIRAHLGVTWLKSACLECPFALTNREGRARVLDAYHDDPAAAVLGLLIERLAVSLNPRQGLIAGARLGDLLARSPRHAATMQAFHAQLEAMPWKVYQVRRAMRARAGDPTRMANAARWLYAAAAGTRPEMVAELAAIAEAHHTRVLADDGIGRVWLRRRGPDYPAVDHFYVAAPGPPGYADDKQNPGFDTAWAEALARPDAQGDLFTGNTDG